MRYHSYRSPDRTGGARLGRGRERSRDDGTLDGRRWAVPAEIARLAVLAAAVALWAPFPGGRALLAVGTALAAAAMATWLVAGARKEPGPRNPAPTPVR